MAKKTLVLDDYGRKKKKKALSPKVIKSGILVLVVLALAAWGIVSYLDYKGSYIGTIDGIKVSVDDYSGALDSVASEFLSDAGIDTSDTVEVESFWISDNNAKRFEAREEALKRVKERAVQLRIAEENGITISQYDKAKYIREIEAQIKSYIAQQASQSGADASKITMEDFIQEQAGMSLAEYKEMYIESVIIDQLAKMKKAGIENTDEELKAWYEKDKNNYDLHLVDTIFVSYQGENDIGTKELLADEELETKKALVATIEEAITAGEKSFAEISAEHNEESKNQQQLKKIDEKISLTNTSADMTAVNTWLNETGINDNTKWVKIEVKGIETGSFSQDVIGVYFVKYANIVEFDTPDSEEAKTMRATIKAEVIADKYAKMVAEWASESRFDMVFNGDVYKKIAVAGYNID